MTTETTITISKTEKAEAGYGFSGRVNTRHCATYGVYAGDTLVGKIVGNVGYLSSNEWIVEDHDQTAPNGCPRRLAYLHTLVDAKAKAVALFTARFN